MADATPSARVDSPTPGRPVWVWHLTTLAVWGFVLALFLRFFDALSTILLGVLAAACLASALRPLMMRLPGRRWLRGVLAGAIPFVAAVALFTVIGWLIAAPIEEELERWPQVRERLDAELRDWSAMIGIDEPVTVDDLGAQLRGVLAERKTMASTANLLSAIFVALAFIFFGAIFLLVEREKTLTDPITQLLPPRRREQLCAFIAEVEPKLRWWFLGTLVSMAVIGVLSWIGYMLAGLQFALPMAALAGVAEIVPTVGPTFAFLVALLLAVTQGTGTVIGVVVVWMLIQAIESYVLVPVVMKRAVQQPPVVTLFTVVLWGLIFGAPGLLLAIPLNIIIWSALKHFVSQAGTAS